jgi:phage-related holin
MTHLKLQYKTMIQILDIKTPLLLLAGITFSWFDVEYVPSPMLSIWLLFAMFGDLSTGLLKSWSKNMVTSSEGFRKSVTKVTSYGGAILVITALVNIIGIVDLKNTYDLSVVINGLMGFIVFTELYSICENILAVYPESALVKFVILPIMKFLRGRFKNNNPLN